jgi:hypothetical protein
MAAHDYPVPVFVEVNKADGLDVRSGHYDVLLTDMSTAIIQEADGYVAGAVFNHRPTADKSAVYAQYPQETFLRHGFAEKGDGTDASQVKWTADFSGSFNCKVYASQIPVGASQFMANVSKPLNPERDALDVLIQHSLIFKDQKWVAAFFKAGVWGVDLQGVTFASVPDPATEFVQWDDYVHSDPVADVTWQKALFRQRTGKEANKMVLGRLAYARLLMHPRIRNSKFGGSIVRENAMTPQVSLANLRTLAMLFDVEEIVLAQAIHDAGNEGQPVSPTFIAGKHMWLGHSPARTNLKAAMAGAHFSWTNYKAGVNNMGVVIDRWHDRGKDTDFIRMELSFDLKIVAPILGMMFLDVIS